jgi:hypothetical protein
VSRNAVAPASSQRNTPHGRSRAGRGERSPAVREN